MRGLYPSLRGNCIAIDEARKKKNSVNQNFFIIFLDCRVASLLAMTIWHPRNNNNSQYLNV
ncbi:hypothetical protein [Rickettsia asembonensis]|uniref:hypothetical protein n=1 Tax=Rickettsia asembonensis TaxID=1068590 RepID=UPI0019D6EA9B|nr:hypothetical protein [Rickettsia asembonensis]